MSRSGWIQRLYGYANPSGIAARLTSTPRARARRRGFAVATYSFSCYPTKAERILMMNSSRTKHDCRFHTVNWTLAALVLLQLAFVAPAKAEPGNDSRAPELGDYQNLKA